MARSAEKKMTALARWRAVYEDKISFKERPKLAADCNSLRDANMFRRQIISEITRKVAQIQNSSLGEFKLRDLNDEINRLFKERSHWEDRIVELGGTDHRAKSITALEKEGKALPGKWGYKYFGAARDLPGVRELFQNEINSQPKKIRSDLSDAYYGYQHEADGVLLPLEIAAEKIARQKLRAEFQRKKNKKNASHSDKSGNNDEDVEPEIYKTGKNPADIDIDAVYDKLKSDLFDDYGSLQNVTDLESRVKRFTNVSIPTQSDIEKTLVNLKRDSILNKYMTDELIADMVDSGTLLGIEVASEKSDPKFTESNK